MEAKTSQTLNRSQSPRSARSGSPWQASRGAASVGGDRPRRDVELAPRHPRRADRCARRRPDPAGPRSRQATRRSGSRGHPHLAQPPRHLRGGGPDHGAPPRARRGIARTQRSDPAGGRPRDHGRRPDEGRGSQADDGRGGAGGAARKHGRYPGRGPGVAGREQPGATSGAAGRRSKLAMRELARDHRPDPDRQLLLLAGQQLPHRRQLQQPDGADGGRHDHRHRRRVRAPARGDRPLDRLRVRHRGRRRREAAVPDGSFQTSGLVAIIIAITITARSALFQGSFVAFIGCPRSSSRLPGCSPGRA